MKEYAKDFYKSNEWKRARKIVIARSSGLCERCLAAGLYRPGYIVHHKTYLTPDNISDPKVALDISNLEYICEDCHNKEHSRRGQERYRFDVNGNLLPPAEKAPPGGSKKTRPGKDRGGYLQKTPQGRAYMRGDRNGAGK